MQGERTVAVGLSLTLHACVVGIVVARLAVAPSLAPERPIAVSFDAPPSIGESAATLPQEVPPLAGFGTLPTVAPASLPPVDPAAAISAAPAGSSLADKGAGLELRPMSSAVSSRMSDHFAPDLQASPPSAGQAIAPLPLGASAGLPASGDQLGPSAIAADAMPIGPLASGTDRLGTIPIGHADSEAPMAVLTSEAASPSQAAAVSAMPDLKPPWSETLGGIATVPELSPTAPSPQVLLDAPPLVLPPAVASAAPTAESKLASFAPLQAFSPPVTAAPAPGSEHDVVRAETSPERPTPDAPVPVAIPSSASAAEATLAGSASAMPVAQDLTLRPAPDVLPAGSLPALHSAEVPGPVAGTGPAREAVIASLAPPQLGTAIDLEPASVPVPSTDATRAQQIRAFVDGYDGGPCFFATVRQVSASSAEIDSFSTTPDRFRQFDRALKASTGVEATVSGQRIWSAQCPAVEYLRQLPHDADRTPTLDLAHRALNPGDILSGTIHGVGSRTFRLFVIAETGLVTDVSDAVSGHDGTRTFSFRPRSVGSGGPFPQILVLVTGPAKLPLQPETVDDLFQPLIAGNGLPPMVAAKMFLVTR